MMDADVIRAQIKLIDDELRRIKSDDHYRIRLIQDAVKKIEKELPPPPRGKGFNWSAVL